MHNINKKGRLIYKMFYQEEESLYMGLRYIMNNYKGSTTISEMGVGLKRVRSGKLSINNNGDVDIVWSIWKHIAVHKRTVYE